MTLADGVVMIVLGYAAIGLPVGIAFLVLASRRIDARLIASSRSVRLLLLPGAVVFWPMILAGLIRGRTDAAEGAGA